MALRLVDVSRWQVERPDPLTIDAARRAGYHIVNVALTGGRGYVAGGWAETYLAQARESGMGTSTYHWLDGRTPGTSQATANLARLRQAPGGTERLAHFVDVEEDGAHGITPPSWAHVRDYVHAMEDGLGHPIGLYTADYWWKPRGWNGAALTPHLMGPPNDPVNGDDTDTSPGWVAGWGGWDQRAVMQWAVRPLPGTGNCSLSVIRDPTIWQTLTGGTGMTYAPDSILAVRHEFQKYTDLPNVALGIVRNESDTSYHVGKSWLKPGSYSVNESARDRAGLTEASSAIDIGWWSITKNGKTHTLRTFSRWLVNQCEAGATDTRDIREIIWSPDGTVVKRYDRLGIRSSGDTSHRTHTHMSWFRDSENRDRAAVIRRYFREQVEGADMPLDSNDKTWLTGTLVDAIVKEIKATSIRATNRNLETVLSDLFSGEQAANSMISPTSTTWRQKQLTRIEQALAADALRDAAELARDIAQTELIQQVRQAVEDLPELPEIPGVDPEVLQDAVARATVQVLANLTIRYTPPEPPDPKTPAGN